jgi:hypothetical protein
VAASHPGQRNRCLWKSPKTRHEKNVKKQASEVTRPRKPVSLFTCYLSTCLLISLSTSLLVYFLPLLRIRHIADFAVFNSAIAVLVIANF